MEWVVQGIEGDRHGLHTITTIEVIIYKSINVNVLGEFGVQNKKWHDQQKQLWEFSSFAKIVLFLSQVANYFYSFS